jgi:hypothetical protein
MAQVGHFTVEEPYRIASTATKSDGTVFAPTSAIWTNDGGSIVVTMANGSQQTFTLVPSSGLNISVTQIRAATTATNVILLYR